MKQLPFIITLLLVLPLRAEEHPTLWLEAGKDRALTVHLTMQEEFRYGVNSDRNPASCELKTAHRTLASAKLSVMNTQIGMQVSWPLRFDLLNPGRTIEAEFSIEGKTVRNVIIASPDPFEDRTSWFDRHPIALYDPEGKTTETMEKLQWPFRPLNSFANLSGVESETIVVGNGISFENSRGLAELLYEKAATGGRILVLAPLDAVPLNFEAPVYSLQLRENPRPYFPATSYYRAGEGWQLRNEPGRTMLVSHSESNSKTGAKYVFHGGPCLLDIVFAVSDDFRAIPAGRIIIEKNLSLPGPDSPNAVESRYYFKALIEKLSDKGERK